MLGKILTEKIAACIEQEIRRICEANIWTMGAHNMQADHAHLFLNAPPEVARSQIAHSLKSATARKVFQHFLERKKRLWNGTLLDQSESLVCKAISSLSVSL